MSFYFTTSGAAIAKAGANVNSTIILSGLAMNRWSDEALAKINAETRYDWLSGGTTVGTNFSNYLGAAEAAYIAMQIIGYDMTGYPLIAEAITRINMLDDEIKNNITRLRDDQDVQKALGRSF